MADELSFYGIRDAEDVATCLDAYDRTAYPEGSNCSFTRFYVPRAFEIGYRLVSDAGVLWQAFESAHHRANLPSRLEIPMESFARAVVQGERLGVSIGQVMRDLAIDMRKRRRQMAEEQAQKTPVKLLLPLVFLILPTIFIVVLVPPMMQFANGF